MDPARFFAACRVVIVAGKGGVGKTTVTAALARAAARTGAAPLIVEVEGKSGLASAFQEEPLGYEETVLSPGDPANGVAPVRARTLTPDEAMLEYLQAHGLTRVANRLVKSGVLDVVATATPGIKDILVLGKVKQLDQADSADEDGSQAGNADDGDGAPPADLILLDAPAAGHAITFLRSASALLDSVRVGPINTQATEVMELLTDPDRCQVILVTLPEETPVNELVETAYSLEDQVGVALGPVVVNGLYPEVAGLEANPAGAADAAGTSLRGEEADTLAAAAHFRQARMTLQREQVDRLTERLPLPQLRLPFLFTTEIGPEEVDILATCLLDGLTAMDEVPSGRVTSTA